MRITLCVDALQPQLSGIGRYTWELCNGLRGRDDISKLEFYSNHALIKDPETLLAREVALRKPNGALRLFRLRNRRRALRSNLVHGPNYFLPLDTGRGIITVHDLSVFRYPEMHPPERLAAFDRLFTSSLTRADHVITDTQTIRLELIERYSVRPDKVSSVPLGVSAHFQPRSALEVTPTISRWGLEAGQYGLSVAAFEPRKRILQLIRAWGRLPVAERNAYPLVLAGASGWRNDEIHVAIRQAESEGWLKNLGFVSESELPHLYAGARLFIYPSIYEGFGLPPAEAMASGIPVLVSNRSCLPEVCGDAARYVDPDDDNKFLTAVEDCLTNTEWRSQAIRRGIDRAAQFTWERCVEDTVAVYRLVNLS